MEKSKYTEAILRELAKKLVAIQAQEEARLADLPLEDEDSHEWELCVGYINGIGAALDEVLDLILDERSA